MFHKILCCLDASERAPGVFDLAVSIAQMSGARLYVVRIVTVPPEFPPTAAGTPTDPLIARMAANAMHDLLRLTASVPDDVSMQPPIVRLGIPWKVILETANERDVNLIVLGSHGYHGWDRVLGTTAAKVANIAERHVLVAHARKLKAGLSQDEGFEEPSEPSATPSPNHRARADTRRAARTNRFRTMN